MTNPFRSISEPGGASSFDEALKAFRAEGHGASVDRPVEKCIPVEDSKNQRVETGLTTVGMGAPAPATTQWLLQPRAPLIGGTYTPAEALRLLNAHYFIGRNNQDTAIYRINGDGSVAYVTLEQFRLENQHIRVEVKSGGATKLIAAEKYWKESPARHERRIVFKPGGVTGADEYNQWRGFAVEPRKGRRKMRRLLHHIWKVICRRNKDKFKYLVRYLAWTVQHPDQQAGVVVVLKSRRQGTGKSTVGVVMLMIFGPHGALVDDSERLLGRFNDWIEPVCFILADEILWAGDHKTVDKLKSRITADTVQIERKNGAIRQIPNRLHMIMTTNHDHAIGAGTGDRRFVVFDIDDAHANDKSWFEPLYRDLEDGGAAEFLYLLQHLNLGRWHPRQILKTSESIEQQRMSGDSIVQWAQACVEADAIVGARTGMPHRLGSALAAETLREAYNGFCTQSGLRASGREVFGKACAEMFGPRQRLRVLQSGAGNDKRRPWGYRVPTGKKWQEKVDARLGIKY